MATGGEFEGEGVSFLPGDLLFGKLRPYLAKVACAVEPGEAIGDFFVLRSSTGVVPRFVQYQMLTREFIDLVDGSTFGSKMPRASWGFMGSILIPLPPAREQQAVVEFLDRETEKIDSLVAEQRRLITLLAEKRQSIISQAVTRGLNVRTPMKASGLDVLGDIPSHWTVSELKHLAKPGTTITYGIVQAGPDVEGGVPYIRTSDMAGEEFSETGYLRTSAEIDRSYARSKVEAGDLVVAIRASLGKGLLVPPFLAGANLTQGTAKVSPGSKLLSQFLLRAFNSDYCQASVARVGKGTTFLEITLEALRRIRLAVPPLGEQREIVAFLAAKTSKIDELIAEAQRAVEQIRERRDALVSAAVTGQIDVRGHADTQAA